MWREARHLRAGHHVAMAGHLLAIVTLINRTPGRVFVMVDGREHFTCAPGTLLWMVRP